MVSLTSAIVCLTMVIYHEARSESTLEQELVAHVVMNRVKERNKSVCEIVKQKNQFSWVKNGMAPEPKEKKAFEKAFWIAMKVANRNRDPADGANHFWASYYKGKKFRPYWSSSCEWIRSYGKTSICVIRT